MKLNRLRLSSVGADGVAGVESAQIEFIYSQLLQKYNCDFYGFIFINQIGSELDEVIIRQGRDIYINVRYEEEGFHKKAERSKNLTRLELIHRALLRIAEHERKLSIETLGQIKDEILQSDFKFEFILKTIAHRNGSLIARFVMCPKSDRFSYYFVAVEDNSVVHRALVYDGKCVTSYIPVLFKSFKWKGSHEFVIKDKLGQVIFLIDIADKTLQIVNLTNYKSPPYFELMKAANSGEEKRQAYKDWLDTLPPGMAGFLSEPN